MVCAGGGGVVFGAGGYRICILWIGEPEPDSGGRGGYPGFAGAGIGGRQEAVTSELTPKEIYTAVLETMAENLSDGVVAPLFYYAIGGFPAMMAYKMVNTLDSMIGYRDERFRQFGCCAARLDDALNYFPARLTALFMAVVADGFVYGGGGLPAGVVPLYPPELLHARQSQFGLSGVCHGRHSGLPLRRCACLSRLVGGKALHR